MKFRLAHLDQPALLLWGSFTPHTPPSSPQPPPVICVRQDMEGVDCKKVLKNINGNVLANEDFSTI